MHAKTKVEGRRRRRAALYRRMRRLLLILALLAVCALLVGLAKAGEKVISGYEYTKTGTLWALLEYCPADMDRWEYINIVMELNGMSDMSVQSDRLYQVPVYGKIKTTARGKRPVRL